MPDDARDGREARVPAAGASAASRAPHAAPRASIPPRAALRLVLALLAFAVPWAASPSGGFGVGTARAADPVIAAAGDIACDPLDAHFNNGTGSGTAGSSNDVCRQAAVATTIQGIPNLQAVLDLGDNQYYCGSYQAFLGSYDKSWGAFKAITHPTVGNHEYLTSGGAPQATGCDASNAGASGHYQYFGAAAGQSGQGYYSFDIGSWHLINLNSSCSGAGGCGATSTQGKWLTADLAANRQPCTLAYWHIPLFSSGGRAATNAQPFFASLYSAGADVVLNGHDHIYERFAPQTSTGALDATNGLREFIVGTGGANHTSIATVAANSLVRDTTTFGALQLTLHAGSYDWKFLNSRGSFTDSGSDTCHRATADTVAPTPPTNLTGTAASPTTVNLNWSSSSDNVGVSGYRVFRNGSAIGTSATTSFSDTQATAGSTATYSVAAYDAAGNQSTGNPSVSVTTPAAPDTTPPSKPVVSATPAATAVTLTWPQSTDNVGVTRYDIARGGTVVGSVPQPPSGNVTFTDSGLAPSTSYAYVVTAFDAAGNSAASAAVPVTTLAGGGSGGTTTLTAVADAKVDASTPSTNFGTGALKVDASPDVRSYVKFDATGATGSVQSATLRIWATSAQTTGFDAYPVTDTSWTETGITYANQPSAIGAKLGSSGPVTASTWKAIDVSSAVKSAGTYAFVLRTTNSTALSLSSREDTAHPPQLVLTTATAADTTPPTAPGTPAGTSVTDTTATISWTRSSDDVGVVRYDVFRGGTKVGSAQQPATGNPSFPDSGLAPSTTYSYVVTAYDAAGNHTDSPPGSVTTTAPPDTTPPSAPGTPTATAVTDTTANLTWTRSSDNVGVVGYDISRNGTKVGNVAQPASGDPTFTDTGLAATTTYSYVVTAYDAAANRTPSPAGSATTTATPDTTPPTTPGTPKAASVGPTTASITWTRSSDNVGVVNYEVLRGGQSVGTAPQPASGDPTFADEGLTASTTYSYVVRALDAAGNHADSAPGSVTTAPPPDTTPPSKPVVVATPATTGVTLTWPQATDDVAVTGYDIARDGTKIGTVPQPTSGNVTFTDTGLTPGTLYSYVVTAFDAGGNSTPSDAVPATTLTGGGADTTPPSKPGTPAASTVGPTTATITWTRSSDDVGVVGYDVLRDGQKVGTAAQPASGDPTFSDTGLTPSTQYSYVVRAADAAGNTTDSSPGTVTTTAAPDTTPPSQPGTPTATTVGATTATVTWTRSSDDVGVVGYDVLRDGQKLTTVSQPPSGDPTFSDSGLTASTHYTYVVRAADAAGNTTDSLPGSVTTAAAPDTTAPSQPGTPTPSAVGSTTATITWTPSTDDVGVVGYDVLRDGQKVGTASQPASGDASFSDTGLTPSTTYSYVVRAADAAGNTADSSPGSVTTTSAPDTSAPSQPGTPRASTVGTTTATITWTRSSDNVGVVGYDVLRDGQKIGVADQPASGDPTFSDTGLTASTTYSYVVRAADAAGNTADSLPGSVTTTAPPDTTAPSKPVVTATPATTSVALTWPRATDNVAVTRYDIARGATVVGTVSQPASGNVTFTDTGLSASTAYSYVVTAFDAAGNSTPSDPVPVTTLAASGGTTTLTAVADAKVDASTPTTNFATVALRVDGSPDVRSYLKFNATGITGTVQSATLRIWATSAQTVGFDAYPVSDSTWTETGLTYANQPSAASIGAKLGSSGAVTASTWKTINVTAMVTGPGTYSIVLETTSATALALSSREDAAHAPQLVITTG